jgi:hypothetical protein
MSTLDSIRERLSGFTKKRAQIVELLNTFVVKPDGKNVGLPIPDAVRARLLAQVGAWGADSYRQILHTCIILGLEELEKIGSVEQTLHAKQPERKT